MNSQGFGRGKRRKRAFEPKRVVGGKQADAELVEGSHAGNSNHLRRSTKKVVLSS
jgi:hypothetical protein